MYEMKIYDSFFLKTNNQISKNNKNWCESYLRQKRRQCENDEIKNKEKDEFNQIIISNVNEKINSLKEKINNGGYENNVIDIENEKMYEFSFQIEEIIDIMIFTNTSFYYYVKCDTKISENIYEMCESCYFSLDDFDNVMKIMNENSDSKENDFKIENIIGYSGSLHKHKNIPTFIKNVYKKLINNILINIYKECTIYTKIKNIEILNNDSIHYMTQQLKINLLNANKYPDSEKTVDKFREYCEKFMKRLYFEKKIYFNLCTCIEKILFKNLTESMKNIFLPHIQDGIKLNVGDLNNLMKILVNLCTHKNYDNKKSKEHMIPYILTNTLKDFENTNCRNYEFRIVRMKFNLGELTKLSKSENENNITSIILKNFKEVNKNNNDMKNNYKFNENIEKNNITNFILFNSDELNNNNNNMIKIDKKLKKSIMDSFNISNEIEIDLPISDLIIFVSKLISNDLTAIEDKNKRNLIFENVIDKIVIKSDVLTKVSNDFEKKSKLLF
jgi:hypothetical protein